MSESITSNNPDINPEQISADVEAFLNSLEHPRKPEVVALRMQILAADASIHEGIKWNAPSFRTSEYFATFHLRAKDGVQIILHRGARKRDAVLPESAVADLTGMLQWLGPDRATVIFRDMPQIQKRQPAFQDLIREWIRFV